jgi:hypothetical protein
MLNCAVIDKLILALGVLSLMKLLDCGYCGSRGNGRNNMLMRPELFWLVNGGWGNNLVSNGYIH